VRAKGANILELGPDVASATADFMSAVPQGFDLEQSPINRRSSITR
jgi:multidrug efflux pump